MGLARIVEQSIVDHDNPDRDDALLVERHFTLDVRVLEFDRVEERNAVGIYLEGLCSHFSFPE